MESFPAKHRLLVLAPLLYALACFRIDQLIVKSYIATCKLFIRYKTCSPCLYSLVKTEANIWVNSRADHWNPETTQCPTKKGSGDHPFKTIETRDKHRLHLARKELTNIYQCVCIRVCIHMSVYVHKYQRNR